MTITGDILAQFRTIGMVFAITLVKAEAKSGGDQKQQVKLKV